MARSEAPIDSRAALAHEPLGSRVSVCPMHGEFEETGHRMQRWNREFWTGCPGCAAVATREREAQAERDVAARLERERSRAIGQACIPARFQAHSFASFIADTPAKIHAVTVVRDFVEQFDAGLESGAGLILAGLPGTGKTHLAAAAMMELVSRRRWVQYVTCLDMIRIVRETWRKNAEQTEREVLRTLGVSVDLLVIDEVGVQYGTDSEQTVIFEIMDKRYAEMRPTILITNQDKQGFRDYVGERVADRLRQTHDWVAFDWPSYRPTARKDVGPGSVRGGRGKP